MYTWGEHAKLANIQLSDLLAPFDPSIAELFHMLRSLSCTVGFYFFFCVLTENNVLGHMILSLLQKGEQTVNTVKNQRCNTTQVCCYETLPVMVSVDCKY